MTRPKRVRSDTGSVEAATIARINNVARRTGWYAELRGNAHFWGAYLADVRTQLQRDDLTDTMRATLEHGVQFGEGLLAEARYIEAVLAEAAS